MFFPETLARNQFGERPRCFLPSGFLNASTGITILKWFYLHGTVLVTAACGILVLAVLYMNAYEKKIF